MYLSLWRDSSARKLFLAGLLILGIIGCGGGGPPTGTITGKVKFNGEYLKGGRVVFVSTEGNLGKAGEIGEDGSYTIEKVPVGPAKITVDTWYLRDADQYAGKNKPPPGKDPYNKGPGGYEAKKNRFTAIPKEYGVAESSGLTYTVTKGKQEHPIELTSKK